MLRSSMNRRFAIHIHLNSSGLIIRKVWLSLLLPVFLFLLLTTLTLRWQHYSLSIKGDLQMWVLWLVMTRLLLLSILFYESCLWHKILSFPSQLLLCLNWWIGLWNTNSFLFFLSLLWKWSKLVIIKPVLLSRYRLRNILMLACGRICDTMECHGKNL